jgi:MFS family permease
MLYQAVIAETLRRTGPHRENASCAALLQSPQCTDSRSADLPASQEKRIVLNKAVAMPGPWVIVAIVTTTQMIVAMSNMILPTIAPKLAEVLGVSPVLIGYQVSLTFGAATLATIFGGNAVLRYGAARSTQIAMLCCITGMLLFAFPSVAAIALGSLAIGAAAGMVNPAAAHILVSHTPGARRNLMFSIKQTGVPVGGVIMSLTAPLVAVNFGYQWSLLVVAIFALIVLVLIQPYREQWDADRGAAGKEKHSAFGGVPLVIRTPGLRWISLVAMMFSAVQRCVMSFTVIYLVAEKNLGLIEAGVLFSVVQVGGSVARICWGWLADRLRSSIAVLAIICVVATASILAMVFMDMNNKPLIYIVFFIIGASSLGWNGVFHAEGARLSPPGLVSMVAAGTTFFVFAGVLIGPALFALVYGVIQSYSQTFQLMTMTSLIALALLAVARRATPPEKA